MKKQTLINRLTAIKIMACNLLLFAVFLCGCGDNGNVISGEIKYETIVVDSCEYLHKYVSSVRREQRKIANNGLGLEIVLFTI